MSSDKDTAQSTVKLNGREISWEEFQRQKEAAEQQKGAELVEVSKNNYKIRLRG